jgi:type IV pilus assembly protein PilC
MPDFKYTTRTKQGQIERGVLRNITEEAAVLKLQEKGLTVVNLTSLKGPNTKHQGLTQGGRVRSQLPKRKFHKRLKIDDVIIFTRQLAVMLESGVTLLRALTIALNQIESERLFRAVEAIRKDLEGGSSFKAALEKHPKVFSKYWIAMVETGEATGQLASVLNELAGFVESSARLKRKVTSSLIYPSVLVFAALGAMILFMTVIVPTFVKIFDKAGTELPVLTQMVVGLSHFLRAHFLLLLMGAGTLSYGGFAYTRTHAGRLAKDQLFLNLPIFGTLTRRVAAARFAHNLSTLLKSGTPIVNAITILINTTDNVVVRKSLEEMLEHVKRGQGMAMTLGASGVFPFLLSQMVGIGEETGELSQVLNRLSDFYEERVQAAVDRITTLIEPLIMIVMGCVIGVLVLSMFLPVFKLGTTMH